MQVISQFNPLTYEVDALRLLMIMGGVSVYGLVVDLVVLVAVTTILVVLAARLYPTVIV